MQSAQILLRAGWGMITLMALAIAGFTVIYFDFRPDTFFLGTKPVFLVQDPVWRTAFYIHITSSMLCLALGPFQFLQGWRKKHLRWHRLAGKIYVVSILLLGCPTGLYMAFFANGGFPTALGFFLLSLVWWYATYMAWHTIRRRDVQAHRRWMVRSFALAFSAVTLRIIWMPLLSLFTPIPHDTILHITAYLNWIPNLVVAELLLRRYAAYV